MKQILIYIQRTLNTSKAKYVKALISSLAVFGVTVYATQTNVFCFFEATKTCIFAIAIACIWSGTFNVVSEFSQAAYLQYEIAFNRLLPMAYLVGNSFLQMGLCLIQALGCSLIFKAFFNYKSTDLIITTDMDVFITLFLALFVSSMMGQLLGLIVKTIHSALQIMPIVLILQLLLSGCLFELKPAVLKAVSGFTVSKWTYETLGSIFDIDSAAYPLALSATYPQIEKVGSGVFQHTSTHVLSGWLHMGMLALLFLTLAYLVLIIRKSGGRLYEQR